MLKTGDTRAIIPWCRMLVQTLIINTLCMSGFILWLIVRYTDSRPMAPYQSFHSGCSHCPKLNPTHSLPRVIKKQARSEK